MHDATSQPDSASQWANRKSHDPFWIGRKLVESRAITPEQFQSSVDEFRLHPERPYPLTLERLALTNHKTIARIIAETHGLTLETIVPHTVPRALAHLLSESRARQLLAFPIRRQGQELFIAVADPSSYGRHEAAHDFPGEQVRFVIAARNDILSAIEFAYTEAMPAANPREALIEILNDAAHRGASDIHFDPKPHGIHVRYRIDNRLIHRASLDESMKAGVIQAIKVLSGSMDQSETRHPQDGQATHIVGATSYNLRISIVPTIRGQKATIRLQDETRNFGSLAELGVTPSQIKDFLGLLESPNGLIYVTGPTGSGKTTLLYALLATQDTSECLVITAEDPPEYQINNYVQCSIDDQIGRTFERMLRAFVRQDPDYILIGETRDRETADVSIRSALTGHIVFSTLHTPDAPSAVLRLTDMGVEPYLIASAVRGVCATRLVRKLCKCATAPDASRKHYLEERFGPGDYLEPKGCLQCHGTGYKGRTAILEIFPLGNPQTQQLILDRVPSNVLANHLTSLGYKTMFDDGLAKAQAGITTMAEVLAQVSDPRTQAAAPDAGITSQP